MVRAMERGFQKHGMDYQDAKQTSQRSAEGRPLAQASAPASRRKADGRRRRRTSWRGTSVARVPRWLPPACQGPFSPCGSQKRHPHPPPAPRRAERSGEGLCYS